MNEKPQQYIFFQRKAFPYLINAKHKVFFPQSPIFLSSLIWIDVVVVYLQMESFKNSNLRIFKRV